MTDLEIYRERIGRYILRKIGGNKRFKSTNCSRILSYLSWRTFLALTLSFVCLFLILVLIMLTGAYIKNWRYLHTDLGSDRRVYEVINLWPSIMTVRNYLLRARDWNSYMKALNWNKTCLDVAHWNEGSSHLGNREKVKRNSSILSSY